MLQGKHFRKDEGGRESWSLRYHTIKLKLFHILLVRLVIILDSDTILHHKILNLYIIFAKIIKPLVLECRMSLWNIYFATSSMLVRHQWPSTYWNKWNPQINSFLCSLQWFTKAPVIIAYKLKLKTHLHVFLVCIKSTKVVEQLYSNQFFAI